MNKNILIGIGAAVIAIAVGTYAFMNNRTPSDDSMVPLDGSFSLRDLLTADADMRCTFSYEDEQVRSSGVVYTAKDVIRVDSESTTTFNNETVQTSSIIDLEYVYVWMDGSTDGYRIAFADIENQEAMAGEASETAPDYNRKHDYDCENWNVEEERFQAPDGVTFIDPMEMLQGIIPSAGAEASGDAGAAADMSAQMCALCDQAGDPESRAQCKAALGCG